MATALFLVGVQPGSVAHRAAIVVLVAVAGGQAAGMLASLGPRPRDRQLAQVRLVADAAQRVVLRPVPAGRRGQVSRCATCRLPPEARVGGDLYEVVAAGDRVRLVVGDAEGKGLPAVQSAAQVLGVFREAAHEEDSLTAIVSRIEVSLARQPGAVQFVTAILAEISADGTKMELLSCGHPPPLLLGPSRPRLADCPARPRRWAWATCPASRASRRPFRWRPVRRCSSTPTGRQRRATRQGSCSLSPTATPYACHTVPTASSTSSARSSPGTPATHPTDDIALLLVYRDSITGCH